MKILILSDSHGHIANLKAAMEIGKKADVKAVIHCGDWDNIKSVETVLESGIPLYTVLGNADVNSDLEPYIRFNAKKFDAYLLSLEIDGRKIGVIHRADIKNEKLFEFKTVFSGHYHSNDEKVVNWTKFVRPGAVINGINLAIYETITGEIEFISDVEI